MNHRPGTAAKLLPAILLVLSLACKGGKAIPTQGTDAATGAGPTQPNATLFFPAEEGTGLAACPVFVAPVQGRQQALEALVDRYLDGPACEGQIPAFPQGTAVRAAYLLDGGIAVVDLTSQARSGGGTEAEEVRVYGLVDTISFNHSDILAVRFLVEGREVDSLMGHLDLSRPLPPKVDLMPAEAREAYRRAHGGA